MSPATKASSNLPQVREETPRGASMIVGIAFLVVLLFCALLIFVLYKML